MHALKILDFANTKWRDRDRSEKITETPAPAVTEPQSVSGGGRRDTEPCYAGTLAELKRVWQQEIAENPDRGDTVLRSQEWGKYLTGGDPRVMALVRPRDKRKSRAESTQILGCWPMIGQKVSLGIFLWAERYISCKSFLLRISNVSLRSEDALLHSLLTQLFRKNNISTFCSFCLLMMTRVCQSLMIHMTHWQSQSEDAILMTILTLAEFFTIIFTYIHIQVQIDGFNRKKDKRDGESVHRFIL